MFQSKQWHEDCFKCTECQAPIGTTPFIPYQDQPYCTPCYENKFAFKCAKCNKVSVLQNMFFNASSWFNRTIWQSTISIIVGMATIQTTTPQLYQSIDQIILWTLFKCMLVHKCVLRTVQSPIKGLLDLLLYQSILFRFPELDACHAKLVQSILERSIIHFHYNEDDNQDFLISININTLNIHNISFK